MTRKVSATDQPTHAGSCAPIGRGRPGADDGGRRSQGRAGVSRTLVSIVVRAAPRAGEQTRARVRAAATELGTAPDQRAR